LLRVEDADGAHGWGEVWCNFPACGAEHRERLLQTLLFPLLQGRRFAGPAAAFDHLTRATAILAIQSGEHGPLQQAIAGIDLALWDLVARRAGEPLWRLLGGQSDQIGVYASGINPDAPGELVARKRAEGYRAFKLKVGFGEDRDLDNLRQVRAAAGADAAVMADVNQAWDLATAQSRLRQWHEFKLGWLEEPLRADRPWAEWRALQASSPAPLAAGENVAGAEAFDALIAAGAVQVVQPDVAKWGGISGTWPVVQRVLAAGLRFCPHYLGAGVGLLHSAHLLAAAGGTGWLEVDANANPLRTQLCGSLHAVHEGSARLGHAPGIGIEPDLSML
jgi:L-alanine-DL-glutamate epimerase-like enolase superfamily enzyme